jgi:hypothetical protein
VSIDSWLLRLELNDLFIAETNLYRKERSPVDKRVIYVAALSKPQQSAKVDES